MLLSPQLLEDIMTTLLEEDGIFGSYVDACYLKQVVGVCIALLPLIAIDHVLFRSGLYLTYYLANVVC